MKTTQAPTGLERLDATWLGKGAGTLDGARRPCSLIKVELTASRRLSLRSAALARLVATSHFMATVLRLKLIRRWKELLSGARRKVLPKPRLLLPNQDWPRLYRVRVFVYTCLDPFVKAADFELLLNFVPRVQIPSLAPFFYFRGLSSTV